MRGDNSTPYEMRAYLSRITPTCVGTTTYGEAKGDQMEDHPHVRGDNTSWIEPASPINWITPTCVGTTQ